MRRGNVAFDGETLKANAMVEVPGASPPSVLIAAHGLAMLRIAGEHADGGETRRV